MKYSITNDTITVVIDGDVSTIHADMPMFDAVRAALFKGEFHRVNELITPAATINNWSKGDFKVINGSVQFKGEVLPSSLDRRILQMIKDGSDPSALTNFWIKLQQNPSSRSSEQLFTFLVHEGIPLTPEGDILAYKSVRGDFRDWHSGNHTNTVGTVNEMPRNRISDDPREACHYGFHVGALAYARDFNSGGDQKLIICKVNPADVVCVPYDCNAQKVRCCRYEVVGLFGAQLPSTVFKEDADERTPSYESDDGYDPDGYADDDDLDDDDLDDDDLDDDDLDDDDLDDDDLDDDDLDDDYADAMLAQQHALEVKDALEAKEAVEKDSGIGHLQLEDLKLEELRRYASHELKIVGASRILGGKAALIEKIRQVRGY